MDKSLLITGAGVDCTEGIDFPLSATLLSKIATYSKGAGAPVDEKLREIIPNLRFSFTKLITHAIESICTREIAEQRAMIRRLENAVDNLPSDAQKMKQHGLLLIKLFNKLATVAENAEIDREIADLIREVFEDKAEDYLDSDSILDIHKMSLSDTFKAVLKATLRLSFSENHQIAQALGAEMLNIENLLIEKFLGFYSNKQNEIKNYIYISWMLWSYLVASEKGIFSKYSSISEIPFYSTIPQSCKAITLNYTSFLEKCLGKENVIYFHGGLSEYVRMDRRELTQIENFSDIDICQFMEDQLKPNTLFPADGTPVARHVIPALVPPLKLKPILSSNYIEKWYTASEWIKKADRIAIIGYSFNSADEHFNDIIRKHFPGKKIYVIAPDVFSDYSLNNFHKIFGVRCDDWTTTRCCDAECKKYQKIFLIKACANNISLHDLLRE